MQKAIFCFSVAALTACTDTEPAPQPAQVRYVVDAPFCGLSLPVTFLIDGAVVGTDTFRVHLTPSHLESKSFAVIAGTHVLGAQTFGGFTYKWRDTVVKAAAGANVTDTLSFYCS